MALIPFSCLTLQTNIKEQWQNLHPHFVTYSERRTRSNISVVSEYDASCGFLIDDLYQVALVNSVKIDTS